MFLLIILNLIIHIKTDCFMGDKNWNAIECFFLYEVTKNKIIEVIEILNYKFWAKNKQTSIRFNVNKIVHYVSYFFFKFWNDFSFSLILLSWTYNGHLISQKISHIGYILENYFLCGFIFSILLHKTYKLLYLCNTLLSSYIIDN